MPEPAHTLADAAPKFSMAADEISKYWDEMWAKVDKGKEALYEETKEWCTVYRCRYDEGILGGIAAYIDKLIDGVLNTALSIVYSALDALMSILFSTVGVIARITDEILIFICYMTHSRNEDCCPKSRILDAILDFIQSICDGVVAVVKKIIDVIYMLVMIWERFWYRCECERLESELQEQYKPRLDAAKQEYGDQYKEYKAVFQYPENRDPDVYYLLIRGQLPGLSNRFKQHVAATVSMYNKWPYGATDDCPAAIVSNALSYVSWKRYVGYLSSMWLSSSNMWSTTNTSGYTVEEYKEMLKYCESHMPKDLYNYVLYVITDAPDYEQVKEGNSDT